MWIDFTGDDGIDMETLIGAVQMLKGKYIIPWDHVIPTRALCSAFIILMFLFCGLDSFKVYVTYTNMHVTYVEQHHNLFSPVVSPSPQFFFIPYKLSFFFYVLFLFFKVL